MGPREGGPRGHAHGRACVPLAVCPAPSASEEQSWNQPRPGSGNTEREGPERKLCLPPLWGKLRGYQEKEG